MAEVFKIKNISLSNIELIDFGLIVPPNEIVDLGNFDQTVLSSQLNTLLLNGTIVRLINDVSVPYSDAYTTTIQVYNLDSSTVDASINKLFDQDITINASLGLRPLSTYVDGSLNLKVNNASLGLYATNSSVGLAIAPFATNSSVGLALNPYATNASVGAAGFLKSADLGFYATNASVGLALGPYATNSSVGQAITPFATNSSVGLALSAYATNASIGIAAFAKSASLNLYATNASVGLAGFLKSVDISSFATNSSVGLALTPFATNSSVGLALQSYATNASVGLAIQNFATNSSVNLYASKTDASIIALRTADLAFATNTSIGLAGFINSSALNPYATNASVGLAIAPFATNASIGLAGFAKQIYVDGSLNAKVNRTLFDSSIAFQTNWNITQEASLNNRVKKTGDTMTGDLVLSGAAFIRRDNSTNRIALYGGTGEGDGAYFQVTGSGYVASPGGRSAEFVIGELADSKYTLFSYDGISSWTPRFTLTGATGLVSINNDISIGGSLRVTDDSSIGRNLPYAQIDVSNGNKLVSAGNYYGQEFRSTFHTSTTTTTATTPTYTSDTSITGNYPAGNYRITASYGMNKNVTNSDLLSRIQVDGATLGGIHNHELSDGTTWLYTTRCLYTTFTEGSHNVDLQFSQEAAGTLSKRDVYLEVIRVS